MAAGTTFGGPADPAPATDTTHDPDSDSDSDQDAEGDEGGVNVTLAAFKDIDHLGGARYRGGSPSPRPRGPRLAYPVTNCQNCGVVVPRDVRRTLGESTPSGNIAWACYQCADADEIADGAAARRDHA